MLLLLVTIMTMMRQHLLDLLKTLHTLIDRPGNQSWKSMACSVCGVDVISEWGELGYDSIDLLDKGEDAVIQAQVARNEFVGVGTDGELSVRKVKLL
jgi:hypothetical protein